MPLLREVLAHLLDESLPIEHRFDRAVRDIAGMGKAIVTGILQVAYPGTYGVWNNTSEGGMKELELWPEFERGSSMGERYVRVNSVLQRLSGDVGVDLWTLDALWWMTDDVPPPPGNGDGEMETESSFGLERHLHDFLRDNWGATSLAAEWKLYSEPGDDEAGYEYPTGVGKIDLLARHVKDPVWLVIELKRGQTDDATVGQVLRYMGWVSKHVADPNEEVRGLIIARSADDKLRYALSCTPDVELQTYQVEFHLRAAPELARQKE
jgi:hypothetical protein